MVPIILLLIVAAGIGAGIYYSAGYWLPAIYDASGKPNAEAFKAIAAALGAAVAALIAAFASHINVGLQLKAGESLEQTKRRLTGELEFDKKGYAEDLEGLRRTYAEE